MSIMDLFVKKTEEPKKKEPVNTVSPKMYAIPTGISNENYQRHLEEGIRAAAHNQGIDYMEFSDAIRSPALATLPENTRYMVTYPTYQTMGMTADKLAKSAERYIQACDKVKLDFETQLAQTRQTEIVDKQSVVDRERAEVERLTKEIHERTTRIQTLGLEITSTENQLKIEEAAFNQAYGAKRAEIEDHISKIKLYLNATTTV